VNVADLYLIVRELRLIVVLQQNLMDALPDSSYEHKQLSLANDRLQEVLTNYEKYYI
jgi:hypothetical protein